MAKNTKTRKTLSWAVITFFLIGGLELATHAAIHGSHGLSNFALSALPGLALACIVKTPIYWLHEQLWDRPQAPATSLAQHGEVVAFIPSLSCLEPACPGCVVCA